MNRLSQAAKKILNASASKNIPYSTSELSILLTGDAQIRKLNQHYRHKNRPTDVLSFSQLEGIRLNPAPASLGDVVISVQTAAKQANQHGISLNEEVLRLLIHGILHLLGYEHERVPRKTVERMFRRENLLLRRLRDEFCR